MSFKNHSIALLAILGLMIMGFFGCHKTQNQSLISYKESRAGGMRGKKTSLEIAVNRDAVYLTESASGPNDEDSKVTEYQVDSGILKEIEDVFKKHRMARWDHKKFTKTLIRDAESHRYCFGFDNGEEVSFSSQHYPPQYAEPLSEIQEIIDRYQKTAQPASANSESSVEERQSRQDSEERRESVAEETIQRGETMEKFTPLTKYIEEFQSGDFGGWVSVEETEESSGRSFEMPYLEYSRSVEKFRRDFFDFCKEHPEYDISKYGDTLAARDIDWEAESMEDADVAQLDAEGIIALFVGAFRSEKFCEGSLLNFFESGAIVRWLQRLEEIDQGSARGR